jgi:RND family efflux transporter MFP subunit
MNRRRLWIGLGAGLFVLCALGLTLWRRGTPAATQADPQVSAAITLATVKRQNIEDIISLYGTVQADPASATAITAPRPVIVVRVLARPGQSVAAGEALLEVADAPAAALAYRQASEARTFAQSELARVQRLYDERLAASDQLNGARKALADADAALDAQRQLGGGQASRVITAPRNAIITRVDVTAGDRLAQDATMIGLANAGALVAKLAFEPSSARLQAGQAVTIRSALGGPPIASRLTMVSNAADQTTKTINALAPIGATGLPVGSAVQAQVVTATHQGFLVPRASVVFDETGPHLFTVSAGLAHRVFVKVGSDHGDNIEVSGPITPGTQVAVQGAYEIQDGMRVRVGRQ